MTPKTPQLAAADRESEATASRGAGRTPALAAHEVSAIAAGALPDAATTTTTEAPPPPPVAPTTTAAPKPKPKAAAAPVRQAQVQPSRSQGGAAAPNVVSAPAGDDVWHRLAKCEAGGRNDANAPYYGYFQFSAQTWRAIGGTGFPNDHSWDVQLEMAKKLQARSGWGQWPACSKKIGVR